MKLSTRKPIWVSSISKNPLVQKLSIIRDKQSFMSQIELRQDKQFSFDGVNARERKRVFANEFYAPSDFAWDIYNAIGEMIEFGYQHKNIAYPSYYADMNRALLSKDEMAAGKVESDFEIDMGGVIIGPSGLGKTEAVKRSIALFPATIIHTATDTAYNKPFLQIPIIKADINSRSTLSLLQNLLRAIDNRAGTRYYDDNPQRKGEGHLIEALTNACWQHGVGLVILDEAQAFITESGKTSGKDSPNAKFLQRLFNSLKVPILLIGTPELEDFLSCNAHTFRRYKKDADIVLDNYSEKSEYWKGIVETILQEYVFCRSVAISDAHHRDIYLFTAGNYSALQIYCKALIQYVEDNDITCLSEALLRDVYEQKKSSLKKLARFHNKPIQKTTPQTPRTKSKSVKRALPSPADKASLGVAEQQSKLLGQASKKLFRLG